MEIVGSPFSFNYTAYDQADDLFVAFQVYDVTTGTAVFASTVPGNYAGFGAYTADFVGVAGKTYLVIGAVYTSGSFTVVDTNRSPGAECFQMVGESVVSLAFNYVAYDQATNLHVRATVFEITSMTQAPIDTVPMAHVALGVYFGAYLGTVDQNLLIASIVYTDSGFTTVDLNRAPGSDNFACIDLGVVNVLASATLLGQCTEADCQFQLRISQGDTVTFQFTARNGLGQAVDLTGAVFTTFIQGPLNVPVSFPNSQHTAAPNQVTNKGMFTLDLSAMDTASLALGRDLEIVTQIVISASTVYYHGENILTVLQNVPLPIL